MSEDKESILTQKDVLALLQQELQKSSTDDFKFIPLPPYPTELCQMPYPQGYETPCFTLFDGKKGNPKEHISRFIDSLGQHARNYDLRLREFSKSLTDRAYTWYTRLVHQTLGRNGGQVLSKILPK